MGGWGGETQSFGIFTNGLNKSLGADADLDLRSRPGDIVALQAEEESACSLLDLSGGRIHVAEVDPEFLLRILQSDAPSR